MTIYYDRMRLVVIHDPSRTYEAKLTPNPSDIQTTINGSPALVRTLFGIDVSWRAGDYYFIASSGGTPLSAMLEKLESVR